MRTSRSLSTTAASLALAFWLSFGASAPAPALAAAPSKPPSSNVAWVSVSGGDEVDRAFAQARVANKPLLLYWGATWCPPCNQLKATLFNRQDFAALSQSFVAVHVDGDRPGAQMLGKRFKVSAYPTMVIFNPVGVEITRLPGEVDAPQVMAVLQLGLAGGRPVKAVLADALAGKRLTAAEWQMLSFYSWETDEQQLLPQRELPDTLVRLALAVPKSDQVADQAISTRLWLKALAASDDGQGLKADAALRQRVQLLLADPARSRQQMDVLTSGARDIVLTLQADPGPARNELVQQYDRALQRMQADSSLSRADRLGALQSRVELARLDLPKNEAVVKLPPALLTQVREQVARDDREISDGYERQAVITAAAYTLGRAGLWGDSDTLLKANLAKSHSAYYLMSQLAGNARKLGRKEESLRWQRQAFEASEGPATRLQWGSSYLGALLELSPADAPAIEKTASSLLTEAASDPGAFAGRSSRSLKRASDRLLAWNDKGQHAAVLQRLRAQAAGLCSKLDAGAGQRDACEALFKPPTA